MDTINELAADERTARIILAIASEPGDRHRVDDSHRRRYRYCRASHRSGGAGGAGW